MSETSQPIQVLDVFNKQNFHTGLASEFVKFPKAQSTVTMPNGVKFGDGTFQNSASTGSSLTVREETGSEISTEVSTIKVSNGTLIVDPIDNSIVTISTSGGSGSFTVTDNNVTAGNVTTLNVEALGTVVNAGSNTANLFSFGSKISSTQTYSTLLTNHQFLVDPFNTTNVTTSGVTSSGLVASYTGTYGNGTPQATVVTNSGIRSFKFDYTNDFIDFATSNSLIDARPLQQSTTLWAWYLIDENNESSYNTFLSTRTRISGINPNEGAGLEIKTQGYYSFRVGNISNNGFLDESSTVPVTRGWHMSALTMTYNGTNYDYILYVDGVSIHTLSSDFITPVSGVRIGAAIVDSAGSAIVSQSFIGHCGITDSALSAANILSIYNELKPYYTTYHGDLTGNADTATKIATITNSDIVQLDATQTLTSKTLTSPTISTILNTGTLTLPTDTDVLVGRDTTDTLTNKTLTSPVFTGTATGFSGDVTGNVTGEIKTGTGTGTTPSFNTSNNTLTLTTVGNTYETFDYTYTGGADTVSTLAFSGTQRNNSQYVVSIYNHSTSTGAFSFSTTFSGAKINYTSQVDIPIDGYAILTIFYKDSTNIFASVSVFS
jgi:hypothetical protein